MAEKIGFSTINKYIKLFPIMLRSALILLAVPNCGFILGKDGKTKTIHDHDKDGLYRIGSKLYDPKIHGPIVRSYKVGEEIIVNGESIGKHTHDSSSVHAYYGVEYEPQ